MLFFDFQGHTLFISLAFAVRIVEALGNAAFLTASFAIIAKEFPNHISTTFVSIICSQLVLMTSVTESTIPSRPPLKLSSVWVSSLDPWLAAFYTRSVDISCHSSASAFCCSSSPSLPCASCQRTMIIARQIKRPWNCRRSSRSPVSWSIRSASSPPVYRSDFWVQRSNLICASSIWARFGWEPYSLSTVLSTLVPLRSGAGWSTSACIQRCLRSSEAHWSLVLSAWSVQPRSCLSNHVWARLCAVSCCMVSVSHRFWLPVSQMPSEQQCKSSTLTPTPYNQILVCLTSSSSPPSANAVSRTTSKPTVSYQDYGHLRLRWAPSSDRQSAVHCTIRSVSERPPFSSSAVTRWSLAFWF